SGRPPTCGWRWTRGTCAGPTPASSPRSATPRSPASPPNPRRSPPSAGSPAPSVSATSATSCAPTSEPPWPPERHRALSLRPDAVVEVAVGRAAHDGLGAAELDVRVEALHQRAVTVAAARRAQLGQTERPVELGVLAAGDVEREPLLGQLDHLGL